MKFTFRKHLTNEIDDDEIFKFLIKFEKKIRNVFEIFNEKQIAKRVIQHLRQKISIIDYVVKFQKKSILFRQQKVFFF